MPCLYSWVGGPGRLFSLSAGIGVPEPVEGQVNTDLFLAPKSSLRPRRSVRLLFLSLGSICGSQLPGLKIMVSEVGLDGKLILVNKHFFEYLQTMLLIEKQ